MASAADLNAIAGIWDDMIAGIRRERPFIATLLEQALPVGASAQGVVTVQVEVGAVLDGLQARAEEVREAMGRWIRGLQRVAVRATGESAAPTPTERMTVETVRTETVASLRRRDPVLGAAIDALDLDLVE